MTRPTRTLFKPESWPGGHRAALAVFVDLDAEDLSWNIHTDAADEAAAERLLTTMADLEIVPTVVVDAWSDHTFKLPSRITCDPAAHIWEAPADLSKARATCKERLGVSMRGAVSLSGVPTLGMEKQDLWFLDGSGGTLPLLTSKGKVVVPYSVWWHDVTWFSEVKASPPSALLEAWSLSLASVRTRGELMTVMVTAQVAGFPDFLETIQRFLDEVIEAGDVWITNGSAIAGHVAQGAKQQQ